MYLSARGGMRMRKNCDPIGSWNRRCPGNRAYVYAKSERSVRLFTEGGFLTEFQQI